MISAIEQLANTLDGETVQNITVVDLAKKLAGAEHEAGTLMGTLTVLDEAMRLENQSAPSPMVPFCWV